MARYGLVIDTVRCIGCHTCSVGCRIENNLPQGNWWSRVLTEGGSEMDTPAGIFPDTNMDFVTLSCQHCDNPACVKVCPVGATYKDPDTGVVRQDYDRCIGCRMCMAACPYTGVRSFNWEEPKYSMEHAVGDPDVAPHQKHTVEKCTLCWHRIAKDLEPFCIMACPMRARTFGDFDDPNSEVSKLIGTREYKQLLTEEGTGPNLYYLV